MAMIEKRHSLAESTANRNRRRVFRKFWLTWHRYIALVVGFLFVILGLTGSVNAFRWELDEWLNPEFTSKNSEASILPLDQLWDKAKAERPETEQESGFWRLQTPWQPGSPLTAWHHFTPAGEEKRRILMLTLNPSTGDVLARRYWGETPVTWVFQLHATLLAGKTGWYAVGVLGVLLLLSVGTGVYLWWPRNSAFGKALTFKRGAAAARINFDIHKLAGSYGALVLMSLAVSGLWLIFPDFIRPIVASVSPVNQSVAPSYRPPEGVQSVLPEPGGSINPDRAVAMAKKIFPNAEVRWVITPEGDKGVYGVQMRQPSEANHFNPATMVWVDRYTGTILATRDPERFTLGETLLNVMWPLHSGEALGLPGRILICLTGFAPLVLYVTGLIRRRQKRRARQNRSS